MKYILFALLAVLAIIVALLVICIIRTLGNKAPERVSFTPDLTPESIDTAAKKLGDMIRIPTVSKAENEDLTEFFKYHEVLENNFPLLHMNLEKTVMQGTLIYRWAGKDSSKLPILFMGHQDVVPASDDGWTVPAYSGEVVDGNLYGRGSQDCKGTMYVQMQAVEELLSEGFIPPCDIYLQYSINEETGGEGAANSVRYLREKGIRLALVLDEGGAIIEEAVKGMDRPYAVIGIMEKGYMDLKIIAKGAGGHSSTPPRNTPAARLFAFANEIEKKRPFNKSLRPEIKEMFGKMAPAFPFGMRLLLGNLWLFEPLVKLVMPAVSPFGEALMATTCCFTMMKGSDAANVIPKEPYLVANLRTSAHQKCADSLAVIKKYAAKHDLEIEILMQRDPSPISLTDSPEYAYVEKCIKKQFPDVGVAPYVIMGGTDCRHFSALTDNAFRFAPIRMSNEQNASCHAINENVTLTALAEGVEFFKVFIKNYGE
ncbi:MAG: M20/M25/M40 family metallo-hydrolase [Lachnospiraceae bacterium]|jgi:carboxypeptidase PM20D1